MNNLKHLLLALACTLFFGLQNASAQNDGGQKHVTIQAIEVIIGSSSQMTIVDNNGEVSSVELEGVNLRKYEKTFGANTVKIQKEINKWTSKGYKIITYEKMPGEGDYFFTNIVLVKD